MEVEPQGGIGSSEARAGRWLVSARDLPLPAVLTIQSGIKRLRYATLMGIKKAKTKRSKQCRHRNSRPVPKPGRNGASLPAGRKKQLQLLSGDPKQVAHELVEKLRFEARAL